MRNPQIDYEFDQAQNAVLGRLSSAMVFVGTAMFIPGVLLGVAAILLRPTLLGAGICGVLAMLLICTLVYTRSGRRRRKVDGGLRLLATAVAFVASASLGFASPLQPVLTLDDAALRQQIERRFETSPMLRNQDLTVSVEDSVATVTGVVATNALKGRALRLAKVKGISRVESEIEVKATDQPSGIDAAGDRSKAGFDKGVDATANAARKTTQAVEKGIGESEQGAGKAAEKTAQRVGKAGEKMTDASITMRVKARFDSEYLLRGSQIHIQTNDHVVTLTGRVSSEAARDRSIELAQNLGGVQSVIDELHVAKP
jgi:osmotically-inducible protein OsmY